MFGSKKQNAEPVADAVSEVGTGVDDAGAGRKKRGGIIGLITLPFRTVAAVVRGTIAVVGAVVSVVLIPFRLAWAITSRIVRLAADAVYAVWRLFAGIVGAILAVVFFIFRVIDRTVGALLRLILRLVRGVITLPLRAFKIGTKVGVAETVVKSAAATAGASATSKLTDIKDAGVNSERVKGGLSKMGGLRGRNAA